MSARPAQYASPSCMRPQCAEGQCWWPCAAARHDHMLAGACTSCMCRMRTGVACCCPHGWSVQLQSMALLLQARAVAMLSLAAERCDDDARLQRIVPYLLVCHLFYSRVHLSSYFEIVSRPLWAPSVCPATILWPVHIQSVDLLRQGQCEAVPQTVARCNHVAPAV